MAVAVRGISYVKAISPKEQSYVYSDILEYNAFILSSKYLLIWWANIN